MDVQGLGLVGAAEVLQLLQGSMSTSNQRTPISKVAANVALWPGQGNIIHLQTAAVHDQGCHEHAMLCRQRASTLLHSQGPQRMLRPTQVYRACSSSSLMLAAIAPFKPLGEPVGVTTRQGQAGATGHSPELRHLECHLWHAESRLRVWDGHR